MRKLIHGGTIVNEGQSFNGAIVIEDNRIAAIIPENEAPRSNFDEIIDATGCFVIPGVIDTHVHFREHRERKSCGSLRRSYFVLRNAQHEPADHDD